MADRPLNPGDEPTAAAENAAAKLIEAGLWREVDPGEIDTSTPAGKAAHVIINAPSAGATASAPPPKAAKAPPPAPRTSTNGGQGKARPRERRGQRTVRTASRDGPESDSDGPGERAGDLELVRCACGGPLDRDHLAGCATFWSAEAAHAAAMLWILRRAA